ncbi:MAG TPA: alpha/beta hydrolase [Tepidisphaeraceae bacterium]|jgi:acetyl esterase/lipase
MNSLRILMLIGLLPLTALAQSATQPTTRPDMTPVLSQLTVATREIPYVADASEKQRLDIYSPRGAKGVPVLMFVHGGEWTKGDKTEISFKPKFFNENGIVFVSINYRLSGTDKHPAQVNDIASAVRWVHDHIGEYGGSPAKMVLMGHSAGCHLVTLLGLDPRPLAKVGMKPADLRAVVSWSGGAFDLPDKVRQGGAYADYIRDNFGPDEAVWRDASPMMHIGDAKPMPRFLFASAEGGNATSREISGKMAGLVRSAGGDAQTALLVGKSHTAANHEIGMPGDVTGEMLLKFVVDVTTR